MIYVCPIYRLETTIGHRFGLILSDKYGQIGQMDKNDQNDHYGQAWYLVFCN